LLTKKKAEEPAADLNKKHKAADGSTGSAESENRVAFVKGISFKAEEHDLREFFADCGEIVEVRIPQRDGRPAGNCYIEFKTSEAADLAVAKDGQTHMDRYLQIQIATPRPGGNGEPHSREPSEKPPGCKTVFIGNLSFYATEDDLSATFADCGTVTSTRIAWDKENDRSKGFGYVEFEEEDAVDKAIAKAGVDIAGRNIRVDYAATRDGGGGGGGGRGGGRGSRGRGGDRGRGRGGDRGRGRGSDRGRGRGRGGSRGDRGGFTKRDEGMGGAQGKKVKLDL